MHRFSPKIKLKCGRHYRDTLHSTDTTAGQERVRENIILFFKVGIFQYQYCQTGNSILREQARYGF